MGFSYTRICSLLYRWKYHKIIFKAANLAAFIKMENKQNIINDNLLDDVAGGGQEGDKLGLLNNDAKFDVDLENVTFNGSIENRNDNE